MTTRIFLCTIIGFAILVSSCDSERERPSIDASTYEALLYETELIFALHTQTMDSVLTKSLLDSVWVKYNVTGEQFEQSHRIYERDVEEQLERIMRVAERLGKEHGDFEQRLYDLRQDERMQQRKAAGID